MSEEKQCLFCGLISGSVPSLKIYEGKNVIAVLSIKPVSKGHVLVIPKEHQAYINTLSAEASFELISAIKNITMLLSQAFNPAGFNIINKLGAGANQRVPHACFEVIPRYENDSIELKMPEQEFNEQELINAQKQILTISKDNTIKTLKAIKEGKVKVSPEVKAEAEKALAQIEGSEKPKEKLERLLDE